MMSLKPNHLETKHDNRNPGDRKDFHYKVFKTPKETVLALQLGGIAKTKVAWDRLFILSIFGGVYLMFGTAAAIAAGGSSTELATQKFLFSITFPIGLVMIILIGGELFTGNCMFMPLALLSKESSWKQAGKVFFCSYIGNFVGSVLGSIIFLWLPRVFDNDPHAAFLIHLAERKTQLGWGFLLLKAIPANMCVCAAVYISVAAEDIVGKITGTWVPIVAFVLVGWEHSIANMTLISMGIFVGADVPYYDFLWKNLLPVTIGNIIGGSIMAVGYWYLYLHEAIQKLPEKSKGGFALEMTSKGKNSANALGEKEDDDIESGK